MPRNMCSVVVDIYRTLRETEHVVRVSELSSSQNAIPSYIQFGIHHHLVRNP